MLSISSRTHIRISTIFHLLTPGSSRTVGAYIQLCYIPAMHPHATGTSYIISDILLSSHWRFSVLHSLWSWQSISVSSSDCVLVLLQSHDLHANFHSQLFSRWLLPGLRLTGYNVFNNPKNFPWQSNICKIIQIIKSIQLQILLAANCSCIDSHDLVKGSENQNRTGGLGVMNPTL